MFTRKADTVTQNSQSKLPAEYWTSFEGITSNKQIPREVIRPAQNNSVVHSKMSSQSSAKNSRLADQLSELNRINEKLNKYKRVK